VRKVAEHWPYAAALFTLVERLGIVSGKELVGPETSHP
jgi:hypothetical protein